MPFFVAYADASQAGYPIIASSAVELMPGPTFVSYPEGLFGELLPTGDGKLVVQQGTRDNRVREWHWSSYPGAPAIAGARMYLRQHEFLRSLRARFRYEAGAGVAPYAYVRDTTTGQLHRRIQTVHTVSSATVNSLTVSPSQSWPTNALSDATVEVLPIASGGTGVGAYQRRTIVTNGLSDLQVLLPWAPPPVGARIVVAYHEASWFRVRVLDVDRKLRDEGGSVRYADTWFKFVIDTDVVSDGPDRG